MARVKRGVTAHAKHKKVLKAAKGFYGRRKNTIRIAKQAVEKSLQYAYRDRRNRKRDMRALWITRINAGAKLYGMSYRDLIHGLKLANVAVDRKIMADMAVHDLKGFGAIVEAARTGLAQKATA